MSQIVIRVLRPMPGYSEGQEVRVAADAGGTPLDRQWRRRLADARVDGCCEIVVPEPKPKRRRHRPKEPTE